MQNITVRPSRMPTKPVVKVTNVGDGGFPFDEKSDEVELPLLFDDVEHEVTAAIPLSLYRKWGGHKKFKRAEYEKLFRRYTGMPNRYRIYLPVDVQQVHTNQVVVPAAIEEHLKAKGYYVDDYKAGMAVDLKTNKRRMKIGKLLADNPTLKNSFDNDPQRAGSKQSKTDLFVVISRHPYDIAGMSFDRGWRSCTHLTDGENKRYVIEDVKNGTLVAYLVKAEDKNINKPIARCRIYKYTPADNSGKKTDFIFVREPTIYGTTSPSFARIVDTWIGDVNELFGSSKGGYFCISPNVYSDSVNESVVRVNDIKELQDIFKKKTYDGNVQLGPNVNLVDVVALNSERAFNVALTSPRLTPELIEKIWRSPETEKSSDVKIKIANHPSTSPTLAKEMLEDYANGMTKYASASIPGYIVALMRRIQLTPDQFYDLIVKWFRKNQSVNVFSNGLFKNPTFPDSVRLQVLKNPDLHKLHRFALGSLNTMSDAIVDIILAEETTEARQAMTEEDYISYKDGLFDEVVGSGKLTKSQLKRIIAGPMTGRIRTLVTANTKNLDRDDMTTLISKVENKHDAYAVIQFSRGDYDKARSIIPFKALVDKAVLVNAARNISDDLVDIYRNNWTNDQIAYLLEKIPAMDFHTHYLKNIEPESKLVEFIPELMNSDYPRTRSWIIKNLKVPPEQLEYALISRNNEVAYAAAQSENANEAVLLKALDVAVELKDYDLARYAVENRNATPNVYLKAVKSSSQLPEDEGHLSYAVFELEGERKNFRHSKEVIDAGLADKENANYVLANARYLPIATVRKLITPDQPLRNRQAVLQNYILRQSKALMSMLSLDPDPEVKKEALRRLKMIRHVEEQTEKFKAARLAKKAKAK